MPQYTVTVRGETITFRDDLTDRDAALILQSRCGAGTDFEKSILWSYLHTQMTPARVAWLHYLVSEENEVRKGIDANRVAAVATDGKFKTEKLMELFLKAKASGLQTPKVLLALGEQAVKLSLAPMHGKNPGFLYINIDADYLGKISPEGKFTPGRGLLPKDDALFTLLNQFADDPAGTAKAYGKITSRCCFCGRRLDNRDSIWNGYGEICSERYGVPYEKPPVDWHPVEEIKKAIEGGYDGIPVQGLEDGASGLAEGEAAS